MRAGEIAVYSGPQLDNLVRLEPGGPLAPGDLVYYGAFRDKTEGVVVKVDEEGITVLWSVWDIPEIPEFTKFVVPLVRRLNYTDLASKLIDVQPMSLPAGGIFYMDYNLGDGEKKDESTRGQVGSGRFRGPRSTRSGRRSGSSCTTPGGGRSPRRPRGR